MQPSVQNFELSVSREGKSRTALGMHEIYKKFSYFDIREFEYYIIQFLIDIFFFKLMSTLEKNQQQQKSRFEGMDSN